MRHARRLDHEQLGQAAPRRRPSVRTSCHTHTCGQALGVPRERDPGARARRWRHARRALGHVLHAQQPAALAGERPAVAALARAVAQRDLGPARRAVRAPARRPLALVHLGRPAGRQRDLDLRVEQLERRARGARRPRSGAALGRLPAHVGMQRRAGDGEPPLDREAVAAPAQRRAWPGRAPSRARDRSTRGRGSRGWRPSTMHAAPAFGRQQLPAAAVGPRPRRLVQVPAGAAAPTRTGAAQQLTARAQVDQVDHLAAVIRVDADREGGARGLAITPSAGRTSSSRSARPRRSGAFGAANVAERVDEAGDSGLTAVHRGHATIVPLRAVQSRHRRMRSCPQRSERPRDRRRHDANAPPALAAMAGRRGDERARTRVRVPIRGGSARLCRRIGRPGCDPRRAPRAHRERSRPLHRSRSRGARWGRGQSGDRRATRRRAGRDRRPRTGADPHARRRLCGERRAVCGPRTATARTSRSTGSTRIPTSAPRRAPIPGSRHGGRRVDRARRS